MAKEARKELLVRVAEMYYIEGLPQKEIAEKVNFSRSNISRFLRRCVDENIVEFKINKTTTRLMDMADKIKRIYKLDYVNVIPRHLNMEYQKKEAGIAAAKYIESLLRDNIKIGLSWGSTLAEVVKSVRESDRPYSGITVHQMVGGDESVNVNDDSPQLTKVLSDKLRGKAFVLNAPLLVRSVMLKELLLEEPNIRTHFEQLEDMNIVLMGIGGVTNEQNAMVKAGYISKYDADNAVMNGAVADLSGHAIDNNGHLCLTDMTDHLIRVDMGSIIKADIRLGVAVGEAKTEPVKAVLKGSYLTAVIIDEEIALELI